MAVDAHKLLLSPPQLFSNRELMMNNNTTTLEPTTGGFQMNGYGVVSPFSLIDDAPPLLHMYGSSSTVDSSAYYADPANADSDLFPLLTRKRSRDSGSNYYNPHLLLHHQNPRSSCVTTTTTTTSPFSFLGQDIDISSHMNQQQHDIDRFVSLHMERVKFEIEEKRKKQARTIMEAIEQGLAKRLRVKEEERERIGKINNALEERVKSLSIENQIWRDLAQTNEATANNLRANLEQVLAQVKDIRSNVQGGGVEEEAESCCSGTEREEGKKMCRKCGEEESCVLVLPCRHLCLCGVCGSNVHTCPICSSPKNASVHVNMSSS